MTGPSSRYDILAVLREAVVGALIGSAVLWLLAIPRLPPEIVMALAWVTVVAVARGPGRTAATFCAVACGLWFGYAHTKPRFQTVIVDSFDVTLTLLTLGVGLIIAELASSPRRRRD